MERLTKFVTPVGMVMTNLNSMKHYMPCVPCVPDRAERDILRKAGLKLYKDGKVFKEAKK